MRDSESDEKGERQMAKMQAVQVPKPGADFEVVDVKSRSPPRDT